MKVNVRVVYGIYVKLLVTEIFTELNMRSTTGKSKPAKHLSDNKSHMFTWKVLPSAPLHFRKRKILEMFFITKLKLGLNDQIEHHTLSLFRVFHVMFLLYNYFRRYQLY